MGCNMSFRRSLVESIGGFSEDLGRIGKTPLGGEETEFCIRARQRDPGALIIFEPLARVHHRVSSDRTRWKYVISRCYSEGLSKAVVARLVGRDAALESERRYVSQVLWRAFLRELAKAGRGQRAGAAGAAAIVVGLGVTTAGYIRGSVSSIPARAAGDPISSAVA
jgi:GT2 family glycosyltransferase